MKIQNPFLKSSCLGAATLCLLFLAGGNLIAGNPVAGDGGLQIVFSDGGGGTTNITASGTGTTDNDNAATTNLFGFSTGSNGDLIELSGVLQPLIPNFPNMGVAGSLTLNLPTLGDFTFGTIASNDTSFGFVIAGAAADRVMGAPETLSVVDGTGSFALDYSTFAAVHGMSFPTTDGYTFVFAPPLPPMSPGAPAAPGSAGRPDLLIGESAGRLKGNNVYDQRKASNKQTLKRSARIFTTNTQKASLLLQNDGGTAANLSLRSSGDGQPRMKVTARSGGKNISAAVKAGRFSPVVTAGGSVQVSYQLKTNRFYAGVLRNSDRDDTIHLRLSGGGSRDNAAMVVKYRNPTGPTRL